jgi:hypothetical protein
MLNSENECSRRTFLGTGLAGAAGFLFGAAHSVRAEAAGPDDITSLSLQEVAALVKHKKGSPVEITRACLVRIEALNPVLTRADDRNTHGLVAILVHRTVRLSWRC